MNENVSKNQISRKEALKKMGKYAAMTAVGTFFILSPKKAHATSPPDPGGGFREGQDQPEDLFEN